MPGSEDIDDGRVERKRKEDSLNLCQETAFLSIKLLRKVFKNAVGNLLI